MSVALVTTSHTPLDGLNDPSPDVVEEVRQGQAQLRAFIRDFDPETVVMVAPDHYNGFFYDLMPAFCIGTAAESVGDYGLPAGPIRVDADLALACVEAALAADVDIALSRAMQVDHGLVQPLLQHFGSLDAVPIVPVFVNCVAEPLGPAHRATSLGRAIGRALAGADKRVLVLGSGGLSHDPPVPRLEVAPPEVAERLTHGRNPSRDQRSAREARTVVAAQAFAAGEADFHPINPAWDREVMAALAAKDFARVDGHDNEWFVREAGHSAHEVRTWLVAYAAMQEACSDFEMAYSYYRDIPAWFAGFGMTAARSA